MIRKACSLLATVLFVACSTGGTNAPDADRAGQWSAEKANAWYAEQPWLAGANFGPSTAINQIAMWQKETFDAKTIDRELGYAESLGFNTMRVFLHHLVWQQDPKGYLERIDKYLNMADRHHLKTMFVLLDDVWDPSPALGKQRDPKPGVHNSGWVQSPGKEILGNPDRHAELEPYIKGIIDRYKNDSRVVIWDLYNEPGNPNVDSYGPVELLDKKMYALMLLKKVFTWAREINPSQPLTVAIWDADWSKPETFTELHRYEIEASDIISFHNYDPLPRVMLAVDYLKKFGRPIVCTEYMARPMKNTFESIMPYLKEQKIGAYNWGFVAGKTQTNYPWDSWKKPYKAEPRLWFHDIFRSDGTPYIAREVRFIKKMTGKN